MIAWFKDRLPAPMAAPETPQLRAARMRIIVGLALIAVIVGAWSQLYAAVGFPVLVLLAGAVGMLVVQVPIYLAVKAHADDAWLTDAIETTNAREAANDA
ncbi:hypothetical protein [Novosphingobium sp. 9U]|uniref:hypothetical protein n=1 Tax=Novosphingobium sp. 9U TaxID=2653158 RepID=UPI0012EF0BA6|nr:hypothetical protein [Novosphingobium sp. 9U]VWX49847.1 conserved hypothetical protein [Novosphingobium sp. 9U]